MAQQVLANQVAVLGEHLARAVVHVDDAAVFVADSDSAVHVAGPVGQIPFFHQKQRFMANIAKVSGRENKKGSKTQDDLEATWIGLSDPADSTRACGSSRHFA